MKKHVFGRQFKRDANERKALFKNLLTSLVLKERIKTTDAKAKAIKGAADKLVTKAKKGGINVYKSLHPDINGDAVIKMMEDIAPRFKDRAGGYTRILKIGKRRVADNAPMVYIEWTEKGSELSIKNSELPKKTKKTKEVKKVVKKATVEKKTATPIVETKQKPKIGGILKQIVTRQKKGQ